MKAHSCWKYLQVHILITIANLAKHLLFSGSPSLHMLCIVLEKQEVSTTLSLRLGLYYHIGITNEISD